MLIDRYDGVHYTYIKRPMHAHPRYRAPGQYMYALELKMAINFTKSLFLFLLLNLFICPSLSKQKTFIVHMLISHKPTSYSAFDWYSSILHSISANSTKCMIETPTILYTYSHAATGFAARVSETHATKLHRHHSVLSVTADQILEAATTQSYKFLGLNDTNSSGIWNITNQGSDINIGVIDTGIWPENPSFSDANIVDPPVNWTGYCEEAADFPLNTCNKKIIGARTFYKGYEAEYGPIMTETKSPRDKCGHGTHCASIAGGSPVDNASYYQYAQGQARGVAPNARISAYKVFWGKLSVSSLADVLKAMDQAIQDGVHVLSMSLSLPKRPYKDDTIAIGAFKAMQRGVVVSVAASNNGPKSSTVKNVAPWLITVGASTINRQFVAVVKLNNGSEFIGSSSSEFNPSNATTPDLELVTGEDSGSTYCNLGQLDGSKVANKMVVCEFGNGTSPAAKSFAVNQAGGLAMILIDTANAGDDLTTDPFFIPAATVTHTSGSYIMQYIKSHTDKPTAKIMFNGTEVSPSPSAPRVAAFSSRGPNTLTVEILKPDVIAPGLNILAAWTGYLGPSMLSFDQRRVEYNVLSGTSMACPHVSGLAALLRMAHRTWSPSAIKSAIMTTAYNTDNAGRNIIDLSTGKESSPIIHGSGHISPDAALDPGLVYDLDTSDYIAFLCSIGYDDDTIYNFLIPPAVRPDCNAMNLSSPGDLNYPSFSVVFKYLDDVVITYTRVVTNVGSSSDVVYNISVREPTYVKVNVTPTILRFNANQRTLSYTISFTTVGTFDEIKNIESESYGSVEWSDGNHRVRSPIAASWPFIRSQEGLVDSI